MRTGGLVNIREGAASFHRTMWSLINRRKEARRLDLTNTTVYRFVRELKVVRTILPSKSVVVICNAPDASHCKLGMPNLSHHQ